VNSVELHIPLFKIVDGDVVDGLILFHDFGPGGARRYCASYESCDDTTDKDGYALLCVVAPVLFQVALGFCLDAIDRGLDDCFDCLLLLFLLCGLEWVTHLTSSSLGMRSYNVGAGCLTTVKIWIGAIFQVWL